MIDGLTIFAWVVMAVMFAVLTALIVIIGSLPGKIAASRNHPQADAINAASWVGLLLGVVGWFIAFVWAFVRVRPTGFEDQSDTNDSLKETIRELQAKIVKLESELAQKEQGN